jgi:outer membrane murein-binding lipoprotein Lpp
MGGLSPFVMAGASNFGGQADQAYQAAIAQVQELAGLVAQAEQQYTQLAEAYAAAVAALDAYGQGQGQG